MTETDRLYIDLGLPRHSRVMFSLLPACTVWAYPLIVVTPCLVGTVGCNLADIGKPGCCHCSSIVYNT